MSNDDHNSIETEGRTANTPSFLIILLGLVFSVLTMIVTLAISRILSALDFGLSFLFFKGLIYILLNLFLSGNRLLYRTQNYKPNCG